ncbi:hypothetical protein AVEN_142471-1 [Araneus ventricosus]|uniref:Uncharacterized protein n=1 Tax=Araneus ventricosus TaxID=182803 RepID=A0A4Y2DTR2_ARAVE|nr:hypothetical protein AVEN_142471-1 [Araneus ventricosus]
MSRKRMTLRNSHSAVDSVTPDHIKPDIHGETAPRNLERMAPKPSSMQKFEENRHNPEKSLIPKLGYYAGYSSEVHKIAQDYLFKNTGDAPLYLQRNRMKVSFVEGEQENVFAKCFSERLQLFHGDAALKTMHIDLSLFSDSLIGVYKLHIPEAESLYPWDVNRVFFAIHSPFEPINPLQEGISVRPGYYYFVEVNLHKEQLLPYPYQTNCANYNITWMKNNRTGPRSQEACKELCRSIFLKDCFGCDPGRIMIDNPEDLCTPGIKLRRPYYFWKYIAARPGKLDIEGIPRYLNVCLPYVEAHQRCHDGCKPDCLKLYYEYNVVESSQDPSPNGDLYSYVGGLMGLWLGISVWTLVGIAEKSFRKSLRLKRKLSCQLEYVVKC